MKRASIVFFCSLFVCLLTTASVVQAGGFALYEWGNRALGMGTANYATGNDASVVAYNPAQMTRLDGTNVYGGVTAISPSSDVTVDGVKSTTSSQIFAVPHGYVTHQLNDDWHLGFGAFTRFGLGTKYDENWDGATLLKQADLFSVSFNPTVAYKVNDSLSLAGGIEIMKGSFLSRKQFVGVSPSTVKTEAQGTAYSGNLGLLYDFTDYLSVGFSYRGPVYFKGTGKTTISTGLGPQTQSDVTMTADFPASYTLGMGYSPIEDLTFEFDVMYTQWESFDRIEFDHDNAALDAIEDFNYKNTWRFQLGAEYLVSDLLALRAGYVYDQTPTRGRYASVMLPANDRNMFTLGAGLSWDNITVDLAGMYIITKERKGLSMTDGTNTYKVDFSGGSTWGLGTSIGMSF